MVEWNAGMEWNVKLSMRNSPKLLARVSVITDQDIISLLICSSLWQKDL